MSSLATNIKHFKQRLNDKERDLLAEITRLEGEARVSGEAEVRDSTDDATSSQGTSESLQEDTLASQTLTQVHDALRRIEDGAYGKCAACGRQVEAARLEAIPWAAYCLEDQEKQEADMLSRTVASTPSTWRNSCTNHTRRPQNSMSWPHAHIVLLRSTMRKAITRLATGIRKGRSSTLSMLTDLQRTPTINLGR